MLWVFLMVHFVVLDVSWFAHFILSSFSLLRLVTWPKIPCEFCVCFFRFRKMPKKTITQYIIWVLMIFLVQFAQFPATVWQIKRKQNNRTETTIYEIKQIFCSLFLLSLSLCVLLCLSRASPCICAMCVRFTQYNIQFNGAQLSFLIG